MTLGHRLGLFALSALLVACGGDPEPTQGDTEPTGEFDCALNSDCVVQVGVLGPCQTAICQAGTRTCAVADVNDGTSCDDGDACTMGDRCSAGQCVAGSAVECDDANLCTTDRCDPVEGCVFSDNEESCDDDNPCTVGDRCRAGSCTSDTNECGCETSADCAEFEDADLCNGTLTCEDGACVIDSATVVSCSDGDPDRCLTAACNPSSGACEPAPVADGTVCGDACLVGASCVAGACAGGGTVDCDDGDPCTEDSCQPSAGCVQTDNGTCGTCEGIACFGCVHGRDCADTEAPIEGTCCGVGDGLVNLAQGRGSEVVDIETDGRYVFLCGGFGVRISDISTPTAPRYVGAAQPRCQRIAIGPEYPGFGRIFWLSHHGDSWVQTPSLSTHRITPSGAVVDINQQSDSSILFEGMAYHREGYLYSATHGGGIRVYSVATDGIPIYQRTVKPFANAWKIDLDEAEQHGYVADAESGLVVLDLADPAQPIIVGAAPTTGSPRDVEVHRGRAYVALGGAGVDVFDLTDPTQPRHVTTLDGQGSVQAVAAAGDLLALASWSHLAVHDVTNLNRLGTEDVGVFPHFDQVLGVAVSDDLIFVGEWEGLHVVQHRPGFVSPDIQVEEELIQLELGVETARAIIVKNRGQLDLEVSDIRITNAPTPSPFSVSPTTLSIPPGGADVFELLYRPSGDGAAPDATARLVMSTNDPDASQNPLQLFVIAEESSRLNVGDAIDEDFAFLDPSGAGQLTGLHGNVVVLAYFALF